MKQQTLKFWKYSPVAKPQYQGKFCRLPWQQIQIDEDGDMMLCGCQNHMPYVVGNIYHNSIEEIWNNPQSQKVRDSVMSGDFTYCNWTCPYLNNLEPRPEHAPTVTAWPRHIKIDLDLSCNLKCPSCREQPIIEKNSHRIDQQTKVFETIIDHAEARPESWILVSPIASGELFASASGLAFLRTLVQRRIKNVRLIINSNGTLFVRNQELLVALLPQIQQITVSLDAATAETYALVRGGNWSDVMQGLEIVRSRLHGLNFVVQKNNYHEIEKFVELAMQKGAQACFQKLHNWGHWTAEWWGDNNVVDRTKNEYTQAVAMLAKAKSLHGDWVRMNGDLENYVNKALTLQVN